MKQKPRDCEVFFGWYGWFAWWCFEVLL